ncbi:MAG: ABC transporter permease [Christensenellaceae bacterium]|jgi:NitT/TauT family transport system permease protein|nr:ABC transporter permease [Christensenellaceae bacterium]
MSINRVSDAQQVFLRRLKRQDLLVRACRWGILLLFLALWELGAQFKWIDAFLISSPGRMLLTLKTLMESGELLRHVGVTLWEMILGFFFGTALGLLLAMALWWSNTLAKILDPYLVVLNALPKIALGPVLIVWMGSGTRAIVVMTLLISVIVTLATVLSGFLEIAPEKLTLLRAFGASKWDCLRMVVLPGSVPAIVSAIKLGIGMSWVGVIVGEFLVSKAGLGYLIVYGGQVFKLDLVMAATAILCTLAALMYAVTALFEKRVRDTRGE